MRALGYSRSPEKVCFGYTHNGMALQAILTIEEKQLEEVDKHILEIPAFLEVVQICQTPSDYQELFFQKNQNQDLADSTN